jgi:hypothetical protein
MRRLTVGVDGHAPWQFLTSMRRLTVGVDGHAPCYVFSSMRRLTVDDDGPVVRLRAEDVGRSQPDEAPLKTWMGAGALKDGAALGGDRRIPK